MAQTLEVVVDEPHPCAYLPEQTAVLEHRLLTDVTAQELENMLASGTRRFGPDYFRPVCPSCQACTPTRIRVADFTPSKSQKRALKRNADLVLRYGEPQVENGRLALYRAWHGERETQRGWENSRLTPRSYQFQFAFPHPSIRELSFELPTGELVGISIVDETPNALSAVYFFSAPAEHKRSLGVANVLALIELAKARDKEHLYLGFLVEKCPSLAYKAHYVPQQRLRHGADGVAEWQTVGRAQGSSC